MGLSGLWVSCLQERQQWRRNCEEGKTLIKLHLEFNVRTFYLNLNSHTCYFTSINTRTSAFTLTYVLPKYFGFNLLSTFISSNLMLSHSPFYFSTTLQVLYIMHFYHILTHTSCCYCVIQFFILHKMLYILILLSVIYFRYTTHSICISSNSEGSKKLPDDGRLLLEHVGASI
jgi:hypothetical protein